jgi:hypothetical protein
MKTFQEPGIFRGRLAAGTARHHLLASAARCARSLRHSPTLGTLSLG